MREEDPEILSQRERIDSVTVSCPVPPDSHGSRPPLHPMAIDQRITEILKRDVSGVGDVARSL